MSIKERIEWLDSSYGVVAKWVFRLFMAITLPLAMYSSTAYLDNHYVSKSDFTSYKQEASQAQLDYYNNAEASRQKLSNEQKELFEKMGGKLDSLLLRDSANTQYNADVQRRLTRLEDKVDALTKP